MAKAKKGKLPPQFAKNAQLMKEGKLPRQRKRKAKKK